VIVGFEFGELARIEKRLRLSQARSRQLRARGVPAFAARGVWRASSYGEVSP
jgi:hypothetical protein